MAGNKLLQMLKDGEVIGVSYIVGVSDATASDDAYEGRYCVPKQANWKQVGDVVRKFLEENPEIRHLSAADITRNVLINAFPCSRR